MREVGAHRFVTTSYHSRWTWNRIGAAARIGIKGHAAGKTGVTTNGTTEVFGDLRMGDLVVANATDSIRSGTAISTLPTK